MTRPSSQTIENELYQALIESESEPEQNMDDDALRDLLRTDQATRQSMRFSLEKFFGKWFRKRGFRHVFLFKKNLKVTNIQFAELLALLKTHTSSVLNGDIIGELLFVSVDEFDVMIYRMVSAFQKKTTPKDRYGTVAQLYADILKRTMVVEANFGSCAVYVPFNLEVNLAGICAESGYIHSCGNIIYIRNSYKAVPHEFLAALDEYVSQITKKMLFIVYAHEDFSEMDQQLQKTGELRDGLDDLKLFVEKFYMDQEPLISVFNRIRTRFADKISLVHPNELKGEIEKYKDDSAFDRSKSIWLIMDRKISPDGKHPGDMRYFICYEQHYSNKNPFQIFNEDKPAWVAPTTIPHSLVGAMINTTRPLWSQQGAAVIGDPFVGTGTTWLESLKFEAAEFEGGDISPIATHLAADNLNFFASSFQEIEKLRRQLTAWHNNPRNRLAPTKYRGSNEQENVEITEAHQWAIDFFDKLTIENGTAKFTPAMVRRFKQQSLLRRIFFYLALRTSIRNDTALVRRGNDKWEELYQKELRKLLLEIDGLLAIKKRESRGNNGGSIAPLRVFQDKYSLGCTVSTDWLKQKLNEKRWKDVVSAKDARELRVGHYDVIVTDPPYGFNTEDAPEALACLYSEVIKSMILALKDIGQLIFAVPDWSFTGRHLPLFVLKEIVSRQVMATAAQVGREVISGNMMYPAPVAVFQPPYYWESERALRRSILHFIIHKKHTESAYSV